MKIAFISSVMGLGSYLWMNYKIDDELSNEEAGLGDLLSEIRSGNKTAAEKLDNLNESLLKVDTSICGENDVSLVGQILMMRTTLNDKFNDLIGEFRDFAKVQAENNTKALISAIQGVIGILTQKSMSSL